MGTVGVIILNYKVKEEVLNCISAVKESDYTDLKILIVDNNSCDGLEEALKQIPGDGFEFIQTGDNLGFTGGNNIGIKKLLEEDCKYIFVLNPDTKINRSCIRELVTAIESNSTIGIVGPKILFEDGKTIWYAGGNLDLNNVLGNHRGVNETDIGKYDVPEETDFVTGAAVMIKTEVLNKVGLFDERYFMYFEDADLCLRAKKAGYKVIYYPKAVVLHKNAQSSGLGSPLQDYFITRNRMLFASKFLPFRTKFAIFREAMRNIKSPTRRLALFDFLLGKFGKGSFIHD